jgi:hypothetical protein
MSTFFLTVDNFEVLNKIWLSRTARSFFDEPMIAPAQSSEGLAPVAAAPVAAAPVVTAPVAAAPVAATAAAGAGRRRRLMLTAVLAGVSMALLVGLYIGKRGTPSPAEKQGGDARSSPPGVIGGAAAGRTAAAEPGAEPEAGPEELLALAESAKRAGLIIMGVSQCGWTRRQREMFGGADSPARKVIESIYIECRTREMCPNIRGYPTWTRGDQQFPGFKGAQALRELVKEAGALPRTPMLQAPSEPEEVNLDEPAEAPMQPQAIKVAADAVGAEGAARVELARGETYYPPLNVPNMPGTAVWALRDSHAADQFAQGNRPRLALANHDPVAEIAHQMASTFEQIAHDAARDRSSATFSDVRLPHSAHISASSDPMQSRQIRGPGQ